MSTERQLRERAYRASCASMFLYSAGAVALPISLVTISRELGFSLSQGGALGFVQSIEQFFVLIASSFLAARFGKIRVLRAGLGLLAAGLALFTLSTNYLHAVTLMLVIGLGNALLEALLTPIVEDLYPGDDGGKMNFLHAFWAVGNCITVLLFGQILSMGVSWRPLFAVLGGIVVIASLWYPSSRKVNLPRSRADFSHMREILAIPDFWRYGAALAFAGGAEGAFAFWSASYIQINFEALPRAAGLGTASFAVGMAVGRLFSSRLAGRLGLRKLIIISLACALAASGSFFAISNLPTLYVFLLFMGLFIACLWPSIQSFAASVLPVDPTVLMIFLSCFGIPGYSSATLLMGFMGDAWGLKTSFIIAPLYLAVSLILMLDLRKKRAFVQNKR